MRSDDHDPRLSQVGNSRVEDIQRTRAEQIDARNDTWRYKTEQFLAIIQTFGIGGGGLQIIAAVVLTAWGWIAQTPTETTSLAIIGALLTSAGILAAGLRAKVQNPDVKPIE